MRIFIDNSGILWDYETNKKRCENLSECELKEDGNRYNKYNIDGTPDLAKEAELEATQLQQSYTLAMEGLMDSKAKERGYDTRYTASARAGVSGSPFQAEGQSFALWMDNCYSVGYKVLEDVKNGVRELPTQNEFLLELPELVW